MITYLTLINTACVIFILFKTRIIGISFSKNRTFWKKIVYSYTIFINGRGFVIPIRNEHNAEVEDDIYAMNKYRLHSDRCRALRSKFSWLKSEKEVRQFQKDYGVVDPEFVKTLVSEFNLKQNR